MLPSKKYIFIGLAVATTLFMLYGPSHTPAKTEIPRPDSPTRVVTIHGPTTEIITQELKTDGSSAVTELPWNGPTTEISTQRLPSDSNGTVAWNGPTTDSEISTQKLPSDSNRTVAELALNGPTSKSLQPNTNYLSNATVTILFWSSLYGTSPWVSKTHTVECREWGGYQCVRTSEKHRFNTSDAIVFHSRASDLFTSVKQALALTRLQHQRWVLYAGGESPVNTPDLGFLNGRINWTGSYMTDAEFVGGAFVVPGIFQDGFNSTRNYLENRTGMAAILVSHCVPERMDWVKKLQKYIDVDVYGKCGTFHCDSREKCYKALCKYRFYLSFENSYCKDYITEKFYDNSLKNEIVPVIIAQVNTSSTFYLKVPPGSFINALDFHTVKDLAEHMKTVGSRPDLYNEYFRWRSVYNIKFGYASKIFCDLCKRLHLDRHSVNSYPNIASWFSFKQRCKQYPVPN